jgi:hypothetical protein
MDHRIHIGEGVFALNKLWKRADALAQGRDSESGNFSRANVREVRFAHVAKSNDTESNVF